MSWERELQALEKAIGDLNAEYDAFLFGSKGKPPIDSRRRVEQLVKRLNAREPDTAADQYRFTTLQGRFNALCERWDRLLLEKEAGRRPGVYGGFAREARRAEPEPFRGGSNAAESSSVQRKAAVDREAELFERYLAARRSRGEDTRGYDLARFKESLAREREKLQQRFGTADVEFDVAEREGRVKLVARRRGESGRPSAENGNED
jgi:hypothetical protein